MLSSVRFVLALGCALLLMSGSGWAQGHVHGPASGIPHGIPQFCAQPDVTSVGERRLVEPGHVVHRQGSRRRRCHPHRHRHRGHLRRGQRRGAEVHQRRRDAGLPHRREHAHQGRHGDRARAGDVRDGHAGASGGGQRHRGVHHRRRADRHAPRSGAAQWRPRRPRHGHDCRRREERRRSSASPRSRSPGRPRCSSRRR